MPDINYKKGELLFNETITTVTQQNSSNLYTSPISSLITQNVIIVEFNEIEYICSANNGPVGKIYGGYSETGADFTDYPFAFMIGGDDGQNFLMLYTENPGTYSLKIYEAIEDSESDSESDISNEPVTIRSYINKNLPNLNWNILPQIFESEGVELTEDIEKYLRETPENMNWNVINSLIGDNDSQWIIIFEEEINCNMTTPFGKRETTISIDMPEIDKITVIVNGYEEVLTLTSGGWGIGYGVPFGDNQTKYVVIKKDNQWSFLVPSEEMGVNTVVIKYQTSSS